MKNRELKFRAWVYYGGKLDRPDYSRDYGSLDRFFEDHSENDCDQCIEQYIGLKDENGKEIYEGDIIKAEYYGGAQANNRQPAKVVWSDFDLCFVARFRDAREEGGVVYPPEDMPIDAGNMEGVKVIGNLHENPELLGGEE